MGAEMEIGFEYYQEDPVTKPQTIYDLVRESVTEFHKKVGQPIGVGRLSKMRSTLIKEEREELLKEICDLAYVLAGGDVEWGDVHSSNQIAVLELICLTLEMDFKSAFQRVHENNLGRITQDDGTIKRREDGKIVKNPNAPKVDLSDLV